MSVDIYALKHPETGEVRYVGKANNAHKRLVSHLRDARRRDTPLYRWIRKLADHGMAPHVEVIAQCEVADWPGVERETIARMRAEGVRLLNVAEGGDEPFCPPDVRSENAKRLNERMRNDPAKARIRQLKQSMRAALREAEKKGRTEWAAQYRQKMRALAEKRPDLFGNWATL